MPITPHTSGSAPARKPPLHTRRAVGALARDRPPAHTVSTVRPAGRFKIETLPSRYLPVPPKAGTGRVYEEYIGGRRQVDGACYTGCVIEYPAAVRSGWVARVQSSPVEGTGRLVCFYLLVWQLSGLCTCLYVAVRGIGGAGALTHVHIVDSALAVSIVKRRFRRSGVV